MPATPTDGYIAQNRLDRLRDVAVPARTQWGAVLNRGNARWEPRNPREPRILTLLDGTDRPTSHTNCTSGDDLTNYRLNNVGLKIQLASAVTATAQFDPPPGPDDPLLFPPAALVGMWVFIPDKTNLTQITINLRTNESPTVTWSRSLLAASMVDGWQLAVWRASDSTITHWQNGEIDRIQVLGVSTGATEFTVGQLFMVCPEKAKLLYVQDGGYKTWMTHPRGYEWMRRMGIPVTLAVIPGKQGADTGDAQKTDLDDVRQIHSDGNVISFHSYNLGITNTMTLNELRQDMNLSRRWLHSHGFFGSRWRAAYTQNQAGALIGNAQAFQDVLWAQATWNSNASMCSWPLRQLDRWNLPRWFCTTQDDATIDGRFADLKKTRQMLCLGSHGISDLLYAVPEDRWHYLWDHVQAGMEEGWLECVTLEGLMERDGILFRGGGAAQGYTETLDETGARTVLGAS